MTFFYHTLLGGWVLGMLVVFSGIALHGLRTVVSSRVYNRTRFHLTLAFCVVTAWLVGAGVVSLLPIVGMG